MADIGPEVQTKTFRDNLTITETDHACLRHPFAQAYELAAIAADLKFLRCKRRTQLGTSNRKAALRSWIC